MGLFGNKKNKDIVVKQEKAGKKAYTEIKVVPGKMAGSGTTLATEMQEIRPEPNAIESVSEEAVKETQQTVAAGDTVQKVENTVSAEALQEGITEIKEQPSAESYKPLSDTGPLPELDIPDTVFEKEPQSALQESRDYIAILLKDLEEVRQENAQLRIPKQEKNPWKVFAVILSLVIVAGLVCFLWFYAFVYRKAVEAGNNGPVPTATPMLTPEEPVDPHAENTYIIKDLAAYVAGLPEDVSAGFKVSAEEYFGYEYLCLNADSIKIYYRNEFAKDSEKRQRILLDNGKALIEFDWEYDLTADIRTLVPEYGNFAQDASTQLAFVKYSEDYKNFPEKIRFVDVTNLYDCGEVDLKSLLQGVFRTEYAEQPAQNSTDTEKLMTLTVNGVSYQYRIPNEAYINAMLYEEDILCVEEYFDLQFTEAGVIFNTVLSLEDGSCLGELTGAIKRDGLRFGISNYLYGAYVQADQEDAGSDGIIDPISRPLKDYILMGGKNKERFLIPVSDEIAPNTLDFRNWIKAEDTDDNIGRYEYIENGEVVSICGIDVSKYQGDIDWEKVKDSGVEYAIIRLGYRGMNEGTLELDPYYLDNVKEAAAAGVKVGIYFFSQAKNQEEAVEEAEFVLEHIKDYEITYPVVFDTEEVTTYAARANGLSRAERTDCCIAFCEKIKEAGYTPMIYANTRYMVMGLELERLGDYDKWFAYYGTSHIFPYAYTMLQYSDTGRVPGIDGAVDLDVSFVDYAAKEKAE